MSKRNGYKEFPRVVYGPNNAMTTIQSENERPEGYFNTRAEQLAEWADDNAKAAEAVEATERRERAKAKLAAEGVKHAPNAQTATLDKRIGEVAEEKETMIAALEEHNVDIPEAATHKQLAELTEKLEAYIVAKAAEDAAAAEKS